MTQTVCISGASAGFGAAMVQYFAARDYRVIALARRADKLIPLAHAHGSKILPVGVDVRDRAAVLAALAELPPAFSAVDILINNAGLALGLEGAAQANFADWQQMVDTNIYGVLHLTHALLPKMVERNHGHIVNIGSVAGEFPYPGGNVYGATKAFIHQFSRNLRSDLLGTAVRVSVIEPGLSGGTEFSDVRFHGDAAKAQKVYENTQPLTAQDIADVVGFCVERPPHVNIDVVSVLPVCQAFAPLKVVKTE